MINCHGIKYNFECEVEQKFTGLDQTSYRVHNLTVVPSKLTVTGDKKEHHIFRLFSNSVEDKSVLNKYTLIEKPSNDEVTFSIFKSDKIVENGFRVKDVECWHSFVTMMKESKPETVKFALFINSVTPTTTTTTTA